MRNKTRAVKKQKRYGDLRVVNPVSNFHTARFHPCQGIEIVLDKPSKRGTSFADDAVYEVVLDSELVLIESVKKDEYDRSIYEFSQRYDLSGYKTRGSISLGSIEVFIKGDNNIVSTVTMQLDGDSDNLVTSINPLKESVKIEPHQMLEVVLSEPEYNHPIGFHNRGNEDSWTYSIDYHHNVLRLKLVQDEIIGDRKNVVFPEDALLFARNYWDFPINPFLSGPSKTAVTSEIKDKSHREHHYWFALDEESLKAAHNLTNDNFKICTLNFKGKCPGFRTVERSVDVILNVVGKHKTRIPRPISARVTKEKVVKREESEKILTNPSGIELVEFNKDFSSLIVEIAQPNSFYSEVPSDARWKVSIEESHNQPTSVKLDGLGEVNRWGHTFQRFSVSHDYNSNESESKFLGAILFQADPLISERRRRLACWITPSGEFTQTVTVPNYNGVSRHSHSRRTSLVNNDHMNIGKKYSGKPRIAIDVLFTELDANSLDQGLKVYKLGELIEELQKEIKENAAKEEAKKKRATTSYNTTTHSAPSEDTLVRKNMFQTGCEKHWSDGNNSVSTSIHYNPKHGEIIRMTPSTELSIRMPAPHKSTSENPLFWAVQIIEDQFIEVVGIKNITSGTQNQFICEVTVRPKHTPRCGGDYPAGKIKFIAEDQTRTIDLVLSNSRIYAPELPPISGQPPHLRIIPALSPLRKETYRHVNGFMHRDAVVINEEQILYIKVPQFSPGWTVDPFVEIVQNELPRAVQSHRKLMEVRDKINHNAPWFHRVSPITTGNAVLIRSLRVQQPYMDLIMSILEEIGVKKLLIGSINFTATGNINDLVTETPLGIVRNQCSVTRTLYFYLGVGVQDEEVIQEKKVTEPEVVLDDPPPLMAITVPLGAVLRVSLSPLPLSGNEAIKYPWYVEGINSNIRFIRMDKVNGKFVFTFTADKNSGANEAINFCAASTKRTINVTVR